MIQPNNGQSSSKRNGCSKQIDLPGLRAAAVAIGIRAAARQAARDLPPDERERFVQRAMKRCSRQKWLVKAQQQKANAVATSPTALSANVRTGADALAETLNERRDKSRLHLSQYVVDGSGRAAKSKGDLSIAPRVRDLSAIYGDVWPEQPPESISTVNVLGFAAIRVERSESTKTTSEQTDAI
jgi:hypothetical protein